MRIKILKSCTIGDDSYIINQTVELDDKLAKAAIADGDAVKDPPEDSTQPAASVPAKNKAKAPENEPV